MLDMNLEEKKMPKFIINASEEVFYRQVVDANSKEELKEKLLKGDFDFDGFQVADSGEFNIDSIEEIENA